MAAAEKVCELTDEYIGPDMYAYKHNHIQVTPEARKQFRGASATLIFLKPDKCQRYRWGSIGSYNGNEWTSYITYDRKPAFKDEQEYIDHFNIKFTYDYDFVLIVHDDHLKGIVDGVYMNHTYDRMATIRRIKRMLRCRKLKVENWSDLTIEGFYRLKDLGA